MIKIPTIAGTVLATAVIGAFAQSQQPPGKTREQVKAELAEAQRTGDVIAGETGLKLNEIYPDRYPKKPVQTSQTRAEVKAETLQAIRAGDVQVGDSGRTLAEEDPPRYEGAPAKPPKLSLHRRASAAHPAASAAPTK